MDGSDGNGYKEEINLAAKKLAYYAAKNNVTARDIVEVLRNIIEEEGMSNCHDDIERYLSDIEGVLVDTCGYDRTLYRREIRETAEVLARESKELGEKPQETLAQKLIDRWWLGAEEKRDSDTSGLFEKFNGDVKSQLIEVHGFMS